LINLFSKNKITIDNLPPGRTILNMDSILSEIEIFIAKNIKVINKTVPIFSEVYTSKEINRENKEAAELYIIGKAILGSIKIKTIGKFRNGFGKKLKRIIKAILE
jgi:hypothetical protein